MSSTALAELQTIRELARQHRAETKRLADRRNQAIRAAIASGLSQTRVAAELGVTRQAVARHANGGTT